MKELLRCCYELMELELEAQQSEHLLTLLHMAEMIDLHIRRGTMEERGWITKDGQHILIESDGAKAIKSAFRKGLTAKSSKETVNAIIDNHEALAEFSPQSMKSFLEECGYEVRPLGSSSSLKGKLFEDGGGYRVAFGGDGYFQYHPKTGSHHGGAYWKIGNGERGLHRYEMDGRNKSN